MSDNRNLRSPAQEQGGSSLSPPLPPSHYVGIGASAGGLEAIEAS